MLTALEEQLPVRRGGHDDDVPALLRLITECVIDHTLDDIHRLGAAAEGEDRRVGALSIVVIGQYHLVFHSHRPDAGRLVQYIGAGRIRQEERRQRQSRCDDGIAHADPPEVPRRCRDPLFTPPGTDSTLDCVKL